MRRVFLSLPTKSIFHILAPLAPFPQDWGLSLPPKHFPANFFRNFFTKGRATFFCIFGAKNYGGERHLSLRQRGGPLSYALYIANRLSLLLLLRVPFLRPSWRIFRQTGPKVAKINFYLLGLVFSRDFRRPQRAKTKYILKVGAGRAVLVVGCLPAFIVSTCAGLPAFEGAGPARGGLWSFGRVFPPFVRFPALSFGGLLANMPLFRIFRGFGRGFRVLAWVCLVLVLCVACVAFVRVWS